MYLASSQDGAVSYTDSFVPLPSLHPQVRAGRLQGTVTVNQSLNFGSISVGDL